MGKWSNSQVLMMIISASVWKDLSLDDKSSKAERAKLALWDYPVTDKYTRIWDGMKEATLPMTFEEALERVRHSPSQSAGFALIGKTYHCRTTMVETVFTPSGRH